MEKSVCFEYMCVCVCVCVKSDRELNHFVMYLKHYKSTIILPRHLQKGTLQTEDVA